MAIMKPHIAPIRFHYQNCLPYNMQFHTHQEYEIFYFESGHCTYIIGGQLYTLRPGDIILMDGMTLHSSRASSKDYCRTIAHFDPHYLRQMLNDSIFTSAFKPFQQIGNSVIHLSGEVRRDVERQLYHMNQLFDSTDAVSYYRFMLALLDLLYYLHPLCLDKGGEPRKMSEKELHVQRLLHYLEQHYAEELHMEKLEQFMYLNRTYLAKIFKSATGMTIFHYVKKRRLNQAKIMLLTDSGISISQVCYEVGFKHLSHFSRLFKQEFGCTPDQYQRISHSSFLS